MNNIKEAFGANIRKLRKYKKLTLDKLSEMSDITPRLLSKIESGDTFISVETLCKISVALNSDIRVLFDFDWFDNLIYYDNDKFIKHHFRVDISKDRKHAHIRSLPGLTKFKINKTIPKEEFTSYLIDFAKTNKMTIYADYFIDRKRENVFKITPDGVFKYMIHLEELKNIQMNAKDKNYHEALDLIREFSRDKKKSNYLLTAIKAMDDKNAREKLRMMLDAMDISK